MQLLFVVDRKQQSLQQQSTLFHEIKENICKETVNICSLVCYEVLSRDKQPAQKMEISTSIVLWNKVSWSAVDEGTFHKNIHPMDAKLFHAGRQTDWHDKADESHFAILWNVPDNTPSIKQ